LFPHLFQGIDLHTNSKAQRTGYVFFKVVKHINAMSTDSGVVKNRIKLPKLEVCFFVVSSKFVIELGTSLLIVTAAPQSASNWEAL